MTHRNAAAPRAGLTLIELLVVICIIGILAAVLVTAVGGALEKGYITETKTRIDSLSNGCEKYKTKWQDYPPAAMEGSVNPVNAGIESLLAELNATPEVFFNPDTNLINTDGDRLARYPFEIKRNTSDLWELEDSWGNPIIYIHNRDYGATTQYRLGNGKSVSVSAVKNVKTGDWFSPDSFQIRSLGPNGVDDNGDGDDICSWQNP